jgi:hypothetical protein
MNNILQKIKQHFDSKSIYFLLFRMHDARVEGWMKGEIIFLLSMMKEDNEIVDYETEFLYHKKRIDFLIRLNTGEVVLLELKALSIGELRGNRNLGFYFSKEQVFKDFDKLMDVQGNYSKYAVAFIYPKPADLNWAAILHMMQHRYNGWACFTNLPDYQNDYFISAWKLA